MLKRFLHIIIIITLIVQLLPVNKIRYVFDMEDEYTTESTTVKGLRTLAEEEYKEIHIEPTEMAVSFILFSNTVFHFDVTLPVLHPGAIPTPPPDSIV